MQNFAFRRIDEGPVVLFDRGKSRDVVAISNDSAVSTSYLLKIQAAVSATSSNKIELEQSRSNFACCIPRVYGCVESECCGEKLSVLAVERMSANFCTYLNRALSQPCTPEAVSDLVAAQASFYNLVRYAAVELKYAVRDLHFKNVGIVTEKRGSSVVFLDSPLYCQQVSQGHQIVKYTNSKVFSSLT